MEKEQNNVPNPDTQTPVKKKSFLNDKLLPFMGKVGNQRHLAAIRDSFQTILPLIIAGAIGLLFVTIVFGGYGSENVSLLGMLFNITHHDAVSALPEGASISTIPEWTAGNWDNISALGVHIFEPMKQVTFDMMAVYIAFLMGYYLGLSRGASSPVISGFVALATYAIFINFSSYFIDAKGLIAAIIGGLVGAEVFIAFSKMRALEIRLPDGVPPSVGKSFAVLIPVGITLFIWSLFNSIIWIIAKNHDLMVTAGTVQTLSLYSATWTSAGPDTIMGTSDDIVHIAPSLTALDWSTNDLDAIIAGTMVVDGITVQMATDAKALVGQWATAYNGLKTTIDALADSDFNGRQAEIIKVWPLLQSTTEVSGFSDDVVILAVDQVMIANSDGKVTMDAIALNWNDTLVDFAGDTQDAEAAASSIIVFTWEKVTVTTAKFGFSAAVYLLVQVPFMGLMSSGGGFFVVMIYVFLVSFFWFFGIHGPNITSGIFDPIWYGVLAANASLVTQMGPTELAAEYMGTYSKPFFDAFLTVGGSGGTMGLIFGVFFFSRRRELKEISKYALPAGIFRINEPVMFGFPLVLNFRYVVPLVLAPMASITIASAAVAVGFMYPAYIAFPWTTPFIVSGLFANGFVMPLHTFAVIITCWIATFAIWFPFVLIDNKLEDKKRQTEGTGSEIELAHWALSDKFNSELTTLKDDLKTNQITNEEYQATLAVVNADKTELLAISKAMLLGWAEQDKLEYKERRMIENKEYKEMLKAMKEQQKLERDKAASDKAEAKKLGISVAELHDRQAAKAAEAEAKAQAKAAKPKATKK